MIAEEIKSKAYTGILESIPFLKALAQDEKVIELPEWKQASSPLQSYYQTLLEMVVISESASKKENKLKKKGQLLEIMRETLVDCCRKKCKRSSTAQNFTDRNQ